MTILLFVMLLLTPQMDWFDALNHSLTTAPTGGFSTRDASIAYYDSFAVESIIIFGMFVNGINYTLLWFLVFEKKFFPVYDDEEFRTYFIIIFVAFFVYFYCITFLWSWKGIQRFAFPSGCSWYIIWICFC